MMYQKGKTQTSILRSKLSILNKPFVEKELLQKIIDKFAPKYKLSSLCALKVIAPIKKWWDVYILA